MHRYQSGPVGNRVVNNSDPSCYLTSEYFHIPAWSRRDLNLACTRVLLSWYLTFTFRNNVILDGRTNSSVGFVGRTVLTESFYNEFWGRNPFLKV